MYSFAKKYSKTIKVKQQSSSLRSFKLKTEEFKIFISTINFNFIEDKERERLMNEKEIKIEIMQILKSSV